MIRPFHIEDTEAMIEIWYAASIVAHNFVPDDFWEREKENIRNIYIPLAESYMYEIEGKPVAFMSLLEDGEVGALFVLPEFQGRGIGRELILCAADLKGELKLGVFRENPKAVGFYEEMGFCKVGEKIEETTGHPLWEMVRKVQ